MNFYDWMMVRYAGKDTPRGDLARDMKRDKDFPKDGSRSEILAHLKDKGAIDECLACFKRCWQDYQGEVQACRSQQ